ncbi:MAG: mechanosensitive ion channel family protein [Deltaproteobacteria bacterium]|uniref:Mechanosensitive ion channel family protein n=1 Tax=Candidatus Desulfacyla euxinica TaxID=2841693 RepID=A0A8J6N188_9DELT|nr:mechanosensitive ion channel family protein [Candidatus Desulfacyla euxinica]
MRRINRRRFFHSLMPIFLLLFLSGPVHSQQSQKGASTDDLEDLLGVIESPTKREAFLNNLKGLIEARRTMEGKGEGAASKDEKQLRIVRLIFDRFEALSKDVRKAAAGMGVMLEEAPAAIGGIKRFLSQSENRARLFILFLDAAIAALAALIFAFFLRRPVRSATARMKDLPSRVAWGFVYVLFKAIPFAGLCVVFTIMSRVFPSYPAGHTIMLLFLVLLLLYQVAMATFRVLFSPDEARHRILALSDENANYLWIWMRRFAIYTFFYFMATRSFLWTHTALPYFSLLRGLLLIPFPVMLTVFILQIAREIRIQRKRGEEEDEPEDAPEKRGTRMMQALIRYWPILSVGYTWAIFLAFILRYERGFEYLFHATLGTVVTTLIMLLALRTMDWAFQRLFRINERVRQRFSGLEEKANRYVMIVRKGFAVAVTIVGLGAIGEIWGIPISDFVASDTGGLIILRAVAIIITLAVIISLIEISNALAAYLVKGKRRGEKKEITQKQKTLVPVIRTAVNIAAGFVGGIIILDRLGVNTTPILAGAGILGLAVGFGSQTLVKDLINGLFILFEESIRVGDFVMVDKRGGMVEAVGLRTVKLRDLNGTVHVIPNSSIKTLSNYSKVFSRTVMDVGVAYREDVDQVIAILEEVGEDLQNDPDYGKSILEPLEIFGLDRFEDSAVIIRARFKTKPLKQWGVKREFYRRMKRVFDERGIEIPFPHRTVYMGEPKEGPAPPMHVKIEENDISGPVSGQNCP